ncbi:MAG: hypothetical protein IKU27_01790 [Clostridia bacterium]|nr:hypothetical protein [Clostridia bacterium]
MNFADMIVLAVIAVAAVFALRVHRKAGGCSCGMVTSGSKGGCASGCSGCPHAAKCGAGRR